MLVNTTQGTVEIAPTLNRVLLKMSGGADSTMLAYLFALYKKNHNPDLEIYTITFETDLKKYNTACVTRCIAKIEELLGIQFATDSTNVINVNSVGQDVIPSLVTSADLVKYKDDLTVNLVSALSTSTPYIGETMNPPLGSFEKFELRDTSRDGVAEFIGFRPLRNINKQGVRELYETYGLMDTLFPLTRSCEEESDNPDWHCGSCWMCQERIWGFGRV